MRPGAAKGQQDTAVEQGLLLGIFAALIILGVVVLLGMLDHSSTADPGASAEHGLLVERSR